MLKHLLAGLLDLVAPPVCVACQSPLVQRSLGFCPACKPLLERVVSSVDDAHHDAYVYGGPLRDALQRLKYEGATETAPALAALLAEAATPLLGKVDVVTAVPLHPRRLRQRGFNQSILLARPVARLLSVPLVPSLLRRVIDTPAQVGKGISARQAQLARAFRASARAGDRSLLVVDDVRTTGATLAAAQAALVAAGARQVFTLALAGTPYDDDALCDA